jgi:serine/threonine-protein kinase ATR
MNIPDPTPFSAAFDSNSGGPTPKEFLVFLRNLIAQNLDDELASTRTDWVGIIIKLADHFLTPFPSNNDVPWDAMHDKIKLAEITLEVVHRATDRVRALYIGPNDLAKKIFTRLLNLCSSLDGWVGVEVPGVEGIPTPLDLRNKSFQTVVDLLRRLGSNVTSVGESDEPTWRQLRNIIVEILEVGRGMPLILFCRPVSMLIQN